MERPNCYNFEKCGNQALTILNKRWCCGLCLLAYEEKIRKLKEKLMIEEMEKEEGLNDN